MTRQTFQVPVAHDVIKFKNILTLDVIKHINAWSAEAAKTLQGPGVQLGDLLKSPSIPKLNSGEYRAKS